MTYHVINEVRQSIMDGIPEEVGHTLALVVINEVASATPIRKETGRGNWPDKVFISEVCKAFNKVLYYHLHEEKS